MRAKAAAIIDTDLPDEPSSADGTEATPQADARSEKLAELRAKTDRQLAEYVKSKLDLAVNLACGAEQERRSGHWAMAEEYQRKWEAEIAEALRFSRLARKSGAKPGKAVKPATSRPRRKSR